MEKVREKKRLKKAKKTFHPGLEGKRKSFKKEKGRNKYGVGGGMRKGSRNLNSTFTSTPFLLPLQKIRLILLNEKKTKATRNNKLIK